MNNQSSNLCLFCPDYCRRANFTNLFTNYSYVERDSGGLPAGCSPSNVLGLNCSSTPASAPACNSSCKMNAVPLICRSYSAYHTTDGDIAVCRGCPDNARYKIKYIKQNASYTCVNGSPVYLSAPLEHDMLLSNSTPKGIAALAGAMGLPANAMGAIGLAGADGGSGTILLDGDTVTMISTRIDPNASAFANGTTVLVGYCNAMLTNGMATSGANSNAVLAHKPGTLYLDGSGNAQLQGTVYFDGATMLRYNYTWYKNGAVNSTGQTGPIASGVETTIGNIQPGGLFAGDNWTLSCRASHDHIAPVYVSGWLNSSTVTMLAPLVPVTQNASIQPRPAYRMDTLKGFCNATYANNSSAMLTYHYKWYLNGTLFSQGTFPSAIQQGTYANIANITSGNLSKFQVWAFSCRANISGEYSDWLDSTNLTISANPPEPPCTLTNTSINMSTSPVSYHCDNADCPVDTCQAQPLYVYLPNEANNSLCGDFNTTECPYGCRIKGPDNQFLNSGCAALCAGLPDDCFVGGAIVPSPAVPICNEYLGNGPASCHGALCTLLTTSSACTAAQGCTWTGQEYCEKTSCTSIGTQSACDATGDCRWMYASEVIRIDYRDPFDVYGVRTACKQCPEQCRLNSSATSIGDCGAANNQGNAYVDCSLTNCPVACRITEPLAPANPACMPYPEGAGTSCEGCPVLCRRQIDMLSDLDKCPTQCQYDADPTKGCTDSCRLDNPPEKACEGCFDCDYDCSFYPAIRTDCSEICSDEALAGPVNIDPNDFIKSLPGAQTSEAGLGARNIGVLYIPAVVLPLFCIVIVVAFIRVLSPILGGDIEIPGLGRII